MRSCVSLDPRELNRRAVVADLGAALGNQPEFRTRAEIVRREMSHALAWRIHCSGWIVEPTGGDCALEFARAYGHGLRRRRIVAIFLREAAAALHFVPSSLRQPHEWVTSMIMNTGSIAYSEIGQTSGSARRPSRPGLNSRERGCVAIARRGASRCIVCGTPIVAQPVSGAVLSRDYRPFTCSAPACSDEERYFTDAMAHVFDRAEWLLSEAMSLRLDLLPLL